MLLAELIPFICSRPRMFARAGTFDEIAAFLEGYDFAMSEFARKEVKERSLNRIKFRRLCPAEDEAFEVLPRLYQQFLDDMQSRL